ncbi:Wilms tumor protein 1-interacting protein homolog [Ruditapes philippinarum]|uniref:Wilms tumor protein 1-interacting protein homolog n=1 Tax=Ruditapes philippinarum TaxID=129788 RepID=UPI00295A9B36|nr:Wilms tumor protein 1-interacting protein homolog [Ruditapes philippinarum]
MANMKNQNISGYPLQGSENVFVGYGKHQVNVSVSENKPPIPAGMSNSTSHMLRMFDNNVNQMLHVQQQPQLQTIQGREIMIGGQRLAGPGIASQIHSQGSYITINGTHNPVNGGSEYSSPRSSVGSAGDSKNSSPRSSLIHQSQQAPPPPYDARFRNSIASNLSSISLDSNRSSPRTSLAGGIIYDRFPSPRNSVVFPHDGGNINMNITHQSLNNRNRFNEAAPPFQSYIVRPPVMNGQILINPTAGTVNVHHIPITQNGNVQAMVANTTHLKPRTNASQVSPPPAIPARVPKIQPGIPQSQSESEIAALTKKLEQDLLISMSPSSSPLPREPPPPYHGPHKTEPMPGLPPRNTTPNSLNRSNAQVHIMSGSVPRTQSSSSVHPSVVSKLQYQVTPPKQKGPTEAELKLNALTQQLEDEMESSSAQGEYFGQCFKCSEKVTGANDACQAMGHIYHTKCFTCCSCGRTLRGKAFYNVHGKVYCEEDYLVSILYINTTNSHSLPIYRWILQAMGKSYHPGCFRCCMCNECLDGVPFTVDMENKVYCVADFHRVFAPKCAACGQAITPVEGTEETVRVVSMEKNFHVDCYHCEDCHIQLTDEPDKRCYPLDDHLYCHMCHIKRLHLEYPDEQFYIDPYTFNILNKTTGNQRDSIAIMPAPVSAYPNYTMLQTMGSQSHVSGGGMAPPPPTSMSEAPPPVPPHRKITANGYDSSSLYANKPMPQVPPGAHNGMKKTITDL